MLLAPRRAVALCLTALVLVAACGGREAAAPTTTASRKPPLIYVAVGASETVGTGADKPEAEAWPRVLANRLGEGGRQVTFTNLGFGGALVADALASSVPKAEKLQPNLVTVWLNVNNLIAQIAIGVGSPATFEQQLGELLHRLRRGGATTVLVANTPALDHLPAYLGCLDPAGARCALPDLRQRFPQPDVLNAQVDAYNQATATVAGREGAVVVDLHAASLAARAEGREASLVSGDGFHPSTAGHGAVAAAFAEAATKAGV
ncbi:MAG: GDSL-type esterase/lipase family protein [Acidimicrobiales bacterium]